MSKKTNCTTNHRCPDGTEDNCEFFKKCTRHEYYDCNHCDHSCGYGCLNEAAWPENQETVMKRYNPWFDDECDHLSMIEDENGRFVQWSDVEEMIHHANHLEEKLHETARRISRLIEMLELLDQKPNP